VAAFTYCPRCATALVDREHSGRTRRACPGEGCGFVHWGNPLPVVAAVVELPGGVVLARAPGWPEKFFGLITGFLEAGESAEAGCLREVKEELSLDGRVESLLGVYDFALRNELIVAFHVVAQGEVRLSEELEAFKVVPVEKLRPWPVATGLAVRDFLLKKGLPPDGPARNALARP